MKHEDFERLKAVCEKEGFTIESYSGGKTAIIKVNNIWEGVEFAEYIGTKGLSNFQKSIIYKISEISPTSFIELNNDFERYINDRFKPSTESAYVEQLKKEAFERFGEIKDGDRFKIEGSNFNGVIDSYFKDWNYSSFGDYLVHRGVRIYDSGKWATKLPKRVEVDFKSVNVDSNICGIPLIEFHFRMNPVEDFFEVGKFLAQQLEKYLNGEIE